MTQSSLVGDWLEDNLAENGLEAGLRELELFARDLNPLERELVRSVAVEVVYKFVYPPTWCRNAVERHNASVETTRRLVNAALGD